MKRKMICVVLLLVFGGITLLTAQETKKNVVSIGLADLGILAGYERIINRSFSVGIETFGSFVFEINTYKNSSWIQGIFGIEGQGKWYPRGGPFFTELGIGYAWSWADDDAEGLLIQPGLGLKIDIGKPGGFLLAPAIGVPIVIGRDKDYTFGSRIGIGVLAKVSLGYCF